MKFWDASAVIPLVLSEPRSEEVRKIHSSDQEVLIWWGTPVEMVSAIARSEREGRISLTEMTALITLTREFASSCTVIEPVNAISERAQRLLCAHALRASDALQLGSALVALKDNPRNFSLVSLDTRLRSAATREGFLVLP